MVRLCVYVYIKISFDTSLNIFFFGGGAYIEPVKSPMHEMAREKSVDLDLKLPIRIPRHLFILN